MASFVFWGGKLAVGTTVSWGTTDVRVALVTAAPTASMQYLSEVTEASTTGYVRKALTASSSQASGTAHFAGTAITWSGLGPSSGGPVIVGAVVYAHNAADSSAPLLAYAELTSPLQTNGSDVTLRFGGTTPGDVWTVT